MGSSTNKDNTRDHDVVQMVSLRADGTPDQTPDYVVVGEGPEAERREVNNDNPVVTQADLSHDDLVALQNKQNEDAAPKGADKS